MIIAIDGPAAAGKSTIARRLGEELGLFFLDTGAMYRSVASEVLRRGVDPMDASMVTQLAQELDLRFDDGGRIWIDGRAGEAEIRSHEVDGIVSIVAANPGVRAAIVPKQKLVAENKGGVVAEGRDTTTVVFPGAEFRFYLNAGAAVRARRRAIQSGTPEREAEIRAGLEERDRIDSTREDSPLCHAAGVQMIETDGLDAEGVVRALLDLVRGGAGS